MTVPSGWRPVAADVALAAAIGAFALGAMFTAEPTIRAIDLTAGALVAAGAAALVLRRRFPLAVLVATSVTVVLYQLLGYPGVGAALPVLCALYGAVERGYRASSAAVTVTALTAGAIGSMIAGGRGSAFEIVEQHVLIAGWVLAAGVLGEVARQRRAYVREVEQRAAEAERTREETARRRAVQERLRIARELHDSLTHTISVIKVQAGVAVHLAEKRGEAAPDALLAIREASSEAAKELRQTLTVLRPDRVGDDPDTEPSDAVGLDHLPALMERLRVAGLEVTMTVTGPERRLPPAVDRALYRIVQESLTNVARHGPSAATVHLGFHDDHLDVQVVDGGTERGDAAEPPPGHGITGMKERAAALGGRLTAGPQPGGGFEVRAELPLDRVGAPS